MTQKIQLKLNEKCRFALIDLNQKYQFPKVIDYE